MSSQDYDIALKSLISEGGGEVLDFLVGGGKVADWINVELPRVRNPRVDLLARMESGRLMQIELDSRNEMTPERMLEYLSGIWSKLGKVPRQIVIYVGSRPMRIRRGHEEEGLKFHYEVIDIRELDGQAMLRSDSIAVNVLAILAGLDAPEDAVRRIMMRIARLEEPQRRADALRKLFILAGLRSLAWKIEEEEKKMPITTDIREHDVIGPAMRKAEINLLRIQLEKRFGTLPKRVEDRLAECSFEDLETLAVRLLDAHSLDELFA